MNTNLKSSSLLLQNSEPKTNFDKPLALVRSDNQLNRHTRQQQKSISRIYSEQARIYFQERNWQSAIVACKNALESDAKNVDAFKILGNIFKARGKKAEALGVYAKALEINPNSAAIYANLGSFYAEQKNWQQALDYYQQAVILEPKLAGAYRGLAQIWEELGDRDRALECFCQAIYLEPDKLTSQEYFSFGKELYRQGKVKEASIFYIHGVELNPKAESELSLLVKMLEEQEQWQEAVVYYHRLMSLSDSSPVRSTHDKPIRSLLARSRSREKGILGLSAHSNNLQPVAISTSRENTLPKLMPVKTDTQTKPARSQSQTEQPDSAGSWNNLGSLYAQKQQWEKAVSCYQEAIALDPNSAKTYRNLARVYSKMERKTKAALCWYQAFALEPDRVKSQEYFTLAKVLLEQYQVDKAIACLHRVIELKPDSDRAYLVLGKLLEAQGKPDRAQAYYRKISNKG